ncbi:hypothetical protein BJY59DRAFT_705849 [Rhodotorula toruloides]
MLRSYTLLPSLAIALKPWSLWDAALSTWTTPCGQIARPRHRCPPSITGLGASRTAQSYRLASLMQTSQRDVRPA